MNRNIVWSEENNRSVAWEDWKPNTCVEYAEQIILKISKLIISGMYQTKILHTQIQKKVTTVTTVGWVRIPR